MSIDCRRLYRPATVARVCALSVLVILGMAALCAGPVDAVAATDATRTTLKFTILSDGDGVGTHLVEIDGPIDNAKVRIETDVVVKVAFVPVYRFEHSSSEVWHDGQLVDLTSSTDDDGLEHKLSVHARGGALAVEADGNKSQKDFPADAIPASLWNTATVRTDRLMNRLTGQAMNVTVVDAGSDTVEVHGSPRPAEHYRVTGDLNRELSYDRDGVLVRVRFAGKDDSSIEYLLQ